jgi:hypothetical protein
VIPTILKRISLPGAIIWIGVLLILIGAARIERILAKTDQLGIISSDPDKWSVIGASVIAHVPGTASPANTPTANKVEALSPNATLDQNDMHTSGQVMAQSPSGITYIAGRTHTKTQDGKTVQSIVIFRFEENEYLPSAQAELTSDGFDRVSAIAITENGDVVIAGHTSSNSFPGTRLNKAATGEKAPYTNSTFVSRYSPELQPLRSSVLEGNGHIITQDLLINTNGNIYLTGSTNASDFPVTPSALSIALSATDEPLVVDYGADSFVITINPNLDTVIAATLLGGSRDDYAYQLDIDINGNIVVAGNTGSSDFPKTVDTKSSTALKPQFSNIFISIIDPNLSELLASSVWGSPTSDYLGALHISDNGSINLCGHTTSNAFPVTDHFTDNSMKGGHYDAWYAQLDQGLMRVERAAYLGGANNDYCSDLTESKNGSIFMVMNTNSPELLGYEAEYPGNQKRGGVIAQIHKSIDQDSFGVKLSIDLIAAFRSGAQSSISSLSVKQQSLWATGLTLAPANYQFTNIGPEISDQRPATSIFRPPWAGVL